MTYHDNDVYFQINGDYSLVGGSYTINDYDVTSGQDPDRKIKTGAVYNFGSDGKITFQVGRKGSNDVASWFNNRIPANQTTFNHSADKLNFAFIGTLILTLTGDHLGNQQQSFIFQNLGIAQGHTGASNNWWFGGMNCTYTPPTQVIAKGKDNQGNDITFLFLRGDNDVNVISTTVAHI